MSGGGLITCPGTATVSTAGSCSNEGSMLSPKGHNVWKNGNEYYRQWKNDVFCGQGSLIWANGNCYEGQWENKVPKGQGVFTWPDGSRYVGFWNKDLQLHQLNSTFHPGSGDNRTVTMRKRSSVDSARGSGVNSFPEIFIWESEGQYIQGIHVPLDPPQWTLDPSKLLRSFTERTKAIVLNRLKIVEQVKKCWCYQFMV